MLILTEKPSVAKDIALALENFSFNKTDNVWTNTKGDCIVSAAGHLLRLFSPEDYSQEWAGPWKNSVQKLPILPEHFLYKPIDSTLDVLKKIEKCFQKYDSSNFILATDAEREGELIGALILNYVKFKNYSSAKRFWVSEALTPDVVKAGIKNAQPLLNYRKYKNEGYARQHADWLVGMNFTRVLTVQAGNQTLFSFGRVQTAILGAIYIRDRNIEHFIPEPYFQLQITLEKNNKKFNLLLEENNENRFKDYDYLNQLNIKLIKESIITKIDTELKKENQPQLFNITGLQKYCSTNFNLSPDETLSIAQDLYENYKCLSYPRTPSTVLGNENVDLFKSKFEILKEHYPQYSVYCKPELITSSNRNIFNSSKLQDHHALIPLNILPADASEKHKKVYEAVLVRFFQTICPVYEFEIKTITAKNGNNIFSCKGKTVIQEGWRIFDNNKNDAYEDLPFLSENEKLPVHESKILEKQTKPKKHFTNASILALMENPKNEDDNSKLVGIGTPATRAAILKTLIDRKYITQSQQQLLITPLGIYLIENILQNPLLADFISIKTTTIWEAKLKENPETFITEIKEFVTNTIPEIQIKNKWEKEKIGACPLCSSGRILEGLKSFYCSQYKEGCRFTVWKEVAGAKISLSDLNLLLHGKTTRIKNCKTKDGKNFKVKFELTLNSGEAKINFVKAN